MLNDFFTGFFSGVIQNIAATMVTVPVIGMWVMLRYRATQENDFKAWAGKGIIPLWVYYLSLENRFSRLKKTVCKINESSYGPGPSITNDSTSLALDLYKAEADSMCLLSYVAIWVRHASSIGVPKKITKAVFDLEEEVVEFNASLVRHTGLLQEILGMKFDEGSEKLLSGQRKAYLRYFLGGSDRVVSTINEQDFPNAGGRSSWTLRKRLDSIKKSIENVKISYGETKALPEGKTLWPDYSSYTPEPECVANVH